MSKLVLAALALMFVTSNGFAMGEVVCMECHEDHFTAAHAHYPAQEGSCEICHTAKPEHFETMDPKLVTTNRTKSTCLTCHADVADKKLIHPALEMGDDSCISCHNPHGSAEPKILKKPMPNLCFDCHDNSIMQGTSVHGILKNGRSCMNCHTAHAATEPKLLQKPLVDLCFSCHNAAINTKDRTIPNIQAKINLPYRMETGWECNNCHSPHNSGSYSRLLRNSFPAKNYSRYNPGNDQVPNTYALCFDCHRNHLTREIDAEGTRFRKDTKSGNQVKRFNLHYAHVSNLTIGSTGPAFGRSCKICHDIHGSTQEHMIKTDIAVGAPVLKFTQLENGGQCAGSCHNVKIYQRLE